MADIERLPSVVFRYVDDEDDPSEFLPDCMGFQWINDPDEGVGGEFKYRRGGVNVDLLRPKARICVEYEGEQRMNATFTLEEPSDDVVGEGDDAVKVVTWTFTGLERVLDGALILTLNNRDKRWTADTPGDVVSDVWQKCQERGGLLTLNKTFTAGVASNDLAWDQLVNLTIASGTSLGAVIRIMRTEMGLVDAWFEGNRFLMVKRYSEAVNRTIIEPIVTLHRGLNLLDGSRVQITRDIANAIYVYGDDNRLGHAEDADSIAEYDRIEAKVDASGVSDQADLDRIASLYLELRAWPRESTTYTLRLGGDLVGPYTHFLPGDLINTMTGATVPSVAEKVRVRSITIDMDDKGVVTASIAVNDYLQDHDILLLRRIEKLMGNLPGGPVATRNSLAPAEPGNVDFTTELVPPADGGLPTVTVDLTWNDVTTDSDGGPLVDGLRYEARWRIHAGWTNLHSPMGDPHIEIPNLPPGRNIDVQVRCVDESGNYSTGELLHISLPGDRGSLIVLDDNGNRTFDASEPGTTKMGGTVALGSATVTGGNFDGGPGGDSGNFTNGIITNSRVRSDVDPASEGGYDLTASGSMTHWNDDGDPDLETTGDGVRVLTPGGLALGSGASDVRIEADGTTIEYEADRHDLIGDVRLGETGGTVGFFGAAGDTRPVVTGSWADGTAGESLAAALDTLNLIQDNSTA